MPFVTSLSLDLPEGDRDYPFDIPAIRQVGKKGLDFHEHCTFLVGENGTGKSTILEAVADRMRFSAKGGVRNLGFDAEGGPEIFSVFRVAKTSARPMDGFFLRAESFFNFATELDELEQDQWTRNGYFSYGGKSLHEQSHGESFFSLFLNRFGDQSLYILDEPEAALSPSRQLAFLVRLHDLVQAHCQFVIATHSPIILAYPESWIYQLDQDGFSRIDYEDTEHFQLTRRFLEDPKRMLRQLLSED